MARIGLCLSLFASVGCSLAQDPPPEVVLARFDPSARVLPMPNDMVRDSGTGLLSLPIDDTLSLAEKELRGWLNQQDGWPSTFTATVSFTAPVDAQTIDEKTLRVFRFGDQISEVEDVTHELDRDGTQLSVTS